MGGINEGGGLQFWPLTKFVEYEKNPRKNDHAVPAAVAAIKAHGFRVPILAKSSGLVVDGHLRLKAARVLELPAVPVLLCDDMTETQVKAFRLSVNKIAELADWDQNLLALELTDLKDMQYDVAAIGFSQRELGNIWASQAPGPDPDVILKPRKVAVSRAGDLWQCGEHRVLCGDSTDPAAVAVLMGGKMAALVHADPPYGMGKENDGVANDNIYREKLDRFQMQWWAAFRPHLDSNASAYIWGNAADLWRLWYAGGLAASEKFEMRNEITWDKKSIAGMASPDLTQFPMASERCLFFQFGSQFLGNINTEDFPEGWEPLRAYLHSQAIAAGITPADIKRVCGCGMYAHWFTRSQFTLVPAKHYKALAHAFPGSFSRPWADLKKEWDQVKGRGRDVINGKLDGVRAYFDNAHDIMRDVWEFPRVTGEDRQGHATPKPVAMMERIMRSSLPDGGICAEPFGGSGSTMIGAERTERICYSMELQGEYVDVAVARWEKLTGKQATLATDGRSFEEVGRERSKAKKVSEEQPTG